MPFPLLSSFQEVPQLSLEEDAQSFLIADLEKVNGVAFSFSEKGHLEASCFDLFSKHASEVSFAIGKTENGWGVFWTLDDCLLSTQKPLHLRADGRLLKKSLEAVCQKAIEASGNHGRLLFEKLPLPKWLFKFGWSTALISEKSYTHEAVMNAVWSLKQQGVLPGYVILKDGWQHQKIEKEEGTLLDFDADPSFFPNGLKALVSELKAAGIVHVGVCHYLLGGKSGLSETLKQKYPHLEDWGKSDGVGSAFQFYHDYYHFLQDAGISFVEITDSRLDLQGAGGKFKPKGRLYLAAQAAAALHFDSPPIFGLASCVESYYFAPLSRQASFLQDDSGKNFKWALWQYCLNSELFSCLFEPFPFPFSTRQTHARSAAILTALSSRGCHLLDLSPPDKSLLVKTILPSGKTLKGDEPLKICPESLMSDPLGSDVPFKVFTSKSSIRVMGVFNLSESERPINFFLSPLDMPPSYAEKYAVYSHQKGFLGVLALHDKLLFKLNKEGSDVIVFSPIKDKVAVIGFTTHFFLPGPIYEVDSEETELHISAKLSGPIAVYSEKEVLEVRKGGSSIPWEWDIKTKLLTIDGKANLVEKHSVYTVSFID